MKLWLDDIRDPPDGSWLVARTADQAIAYMRTAVDIGDPINEASLDHDLGHCDKCEGCNGYLSSCGCRCHLSGTFVVNWMATEKVWPAKVRIHSMNPVGAKNMQATLLRYGPYDRVDWVPIQYLDGQKVCGQRPYEGGHACILPDGHKYFHDSGVPSPDRLWGVWARVGGKGPFPPQPRQLMFDFLDDSIDGHSVRTISEKPGHKLFQGETLAAVADDYEGLWLVGIYIGTKQQPCSAPLSFFAAQENAPRKIAFDPCPPGSAIHIQIENRGNKQKRGALYLFGKEFD